MHDDEKWQLADEDVRKNLPPGVKLVRTLRGSVGYIGSINWSPDGQMLVSASNKTILFWDLETGECIHKLEGHDDWINCLVFDPAGHILASGSSDLTIKLWDLETEECIHKLEGHDDWINCLAFDPAGHILASGSNDHTIKIWDLATFECIHTLEGHDESISCISFDPAGHILAGGSDDKTIKLWDLKTGECIHTLEGHDESICCISFDPAGHILASGSYDKTIKLWNPLHGKLIRNLEGHLDDVTSVSFFNNSNLLASKDKNMISIWIADTGEQVVIIPENAEMHPNYLAFHPRLPILASECAISEGEDVIYIYELDLTFLQNQSTSQTVTYSSAKIVLVGDSGVGKTGLGWRLAHEEFKEHSSTHGQQFWLLNQLCKLRNDGAQCEAVLWDLAGQRDYRLIHALFLDDVDLALVLFDPTHDDDPLRGVEFWLKQLKVKAQPLSGTSTILIAARTDRGSPRMTEEELNAFCRDRGIKSYLRTSAKSGEGIEILIQLMKTIIPWEEKPATVTTETFKKIKDFVLELKENSHRRKVILTPKELRQRLEKKGCMGKFSDDEMMTAVGHLENHGYVRRLVTSKGETRILLVPELLNNLAASFVLEARLNPEGLGSLEEQRLLLDEYKFPELKKLTREERYILLDSGAVLFLEHNVCFRETNPLNNLAYLVFPELINMKKPHIEDDTPIEEGVAYTVNGAIENVYASLVVLMGYTQTFARKNHWQNHARYEVGKGLVCGFRLEEERAGELDFVLYFGKNTPIHVRTLFQSLFENFLARRNLTVLRFEPMLCPEKHMINRSVIRELISSGLKVAFCSRCGKQITLPKVNEPIHLTKQQVEDVEANRLVVDQRTRFEQVLFRLKSFIIDKGISSLECFISYAWGNTDQEIWVERSLATDLQKAGIKVVLDRWENVRIGVSVPRFVERIGKTDRIIVVGTPLYRRKYENNEPMGSFVLAAEGDLIGNRMLGTEKEKESILPILLEGNKESSFPFLLQSRVYADFCDNKAYFIEMLNLILSIYQIKNTDQVAVELNESLTGKKELGMTKK